MSRHAVAFVLVCTLLGSAPGAAQDRIPEAAPPDPRTTIPEKIEPPQSGIAGPGGGESLSEHLDRTEGVIAPKGNPDPSITIPPPETGPGSMPVIPPPGSPGGDPDIRPK